MSFGKRLCMAKSSKVSALEVIWVVTDRLLDFDSGPGIVFLSWYCSDQVQIRDLNIPFWLYYTFIQFWMLYLNLLKFFLTNILFCKPYLKGQCHEIFRFWFFSSISFHPAPEYPIRTVSNFFENSRRYSRLKVDHQCRWHQWQMRKIFNQKNYNNFVGTPLDSRVNTYIHFCL